jgi:hypothetical protein
MQHKSFPAKIDDCEIEFQLKQLKFRDQEEVVSLVGIVSQQGKTEALKAIRQAMQICLVGWSLEKPVEQWDEELDIVQAIQVVNQCLKGNTPTETERKKSELPHS